MLIDNNKKPRENHKVFCWCPGQDLNLHSQGPLPPQSSVSTNFTTWANTVCACLPAGRFGCECECEGMQKYKIFKPGNSFCESGIPRTAFLYELYKLYKLYKLCPWLYQTESECHKDSDTNRYEFLKVVTVVFFRFKQDRSGDMQEDPYDNRHDIIKINRDRCSG